MSSIASESARAMKTMMMIFKLSVHSVANYSSDDILYFLKTTGILPVYSLVTMVLYD